MLSLDKYAKQLKGKTLKSLEYGLEDRARQLGIELTGRTILGAYVGIDESREDAGTWLLLADAHTSGISVFVYANEGIETEEIMQ